MNSPRKRDSVSSPAKRDEHLLKLIIIGDCGVGKTNILMRYCENQFKINYVSTIGVDFKVKSIVVGEKRLKFQIWDTAGQERYRNITQTYYKGAAGIILAYSVAEEKSFQNLQKWIKQINEHVPKHVVKIIVANKIDISADQREVQSLEGKTVADKFGMPFVQVSAKTGINIPELFRKVGEQIVEVYLPANENDDPRTLLTNRMDTKKGKNKNCQC